MIRVAANLAWLVPGRVGGSEEYSVRLLSAVIAAAPTDVELRVIGSPALFSAYPALTGVDCVRLSGPMHLRPWRIAAESSTVYRHTGDADVVHHFGGRVPARHHGHDVVTIHDLQPLHVPENFSFVKRRYLAAVLPRSARAARIVVTPSEWVASTVVDRLGCDADRVRAVSSTWDVDDEVDETLAASLGDGPVVLYPAVTHPHKRHQLLLAAMEHVRSRHADVVVVLTGGPGRAETEVDAAIAGSSVRVVRPGRVPAATLRGLYRRADVVAFPSAYEGYGLPVLEAMRAGIPVVATDTGALAEVVGDGGRLVESADPQAWGDAIAAALDGGESVDAMRERGLQRVDAWSPPAAAQRLLAVWRSVAGR